MPAPRFNASALWYGLAACSGCLASSRPKQKLLDGDKVFLFEQPGHNPQVGDEAIFFLPSLLRSPLAKYGRRMNRRHCMRRPGSLKDTPSFNAYLEVTSQERLSSRCSQA